MTESGIRVSDIFWPNGKLGADSRVDEGVGGM